MGICLNNNLDMEGLWNEHIWEDVFSESKGVEKEAFDREQELNELKSFQSEGVEFELNLPNETPNELYFQFLVDSILEEEEKMGSH